MDNFDLDKDLEALWQDSEQKGKTLLANIDVENTVKQQSKGVDFKIFRNMALEIAVGFAFSIYVFFLLESGFLLWPFIIFSTFVLGFSIFFFIQIWQKFKALNSSNLSLSLAKRIQIFQLYLRATRLIYYVLVPLGFYLGLIIGYQEGAEAELIDTIFSPGLWVIALVLTPFLVLFIWFFERKYLYWFYGRYLDEYKKMLAELQS
jgi:hypothetical protein